MKPAPFDYHGPETVEQAVELLAEHGFEAKVLAGGQSLIPLLNMRLAYPTVLIDINRIPELGALSEEDGGLRVGATVRQSRFGDSELVRHELPLAAACMPFVGHGVTRNRGTVGGSLAHADPRGELPLVLLVLGGTVIAASVRGRREIAAEDLFVSHYTTSLEDDELLVESIWPSAENGWCFSFEEFAQRHGDFALAMTAVALRVDGGTVTGARVGVGAVGERPQLVPGAAQVLVGSGLDPDLVAAAGDRVMEAIEPTSDLHASADYRIHLAGVLIRRALGSAWQQAGASR